MIMNLGAVRQVEAGLCVDAATLSAAFDPPRERVTAASLRMAQAQALAREQVGQLQEAIAALTRLAAEIAEGDCAYPAGVRSVCERLAEDLAGRSRQMQGVLQRCAEVTQRCARTGAALGLVVTSAAC
jgi:hypothetical protein